MRAVGSVLLGLVAFLHPIVLSHAIDVGTEARHRETLRLEQAEQRMSRQVRIVTDVMTDPRFAMQMQTITTHLAHTWLLFGATSRDPELRVELASPVVNGLAKGLAVAVTEYRRTPVDVGHYDMNLPPGTERTVLVLERNTTLTNVDIFDPFQAAGENTGKIGPVLDVWLKNALDNDHLQSNALDWGQFGTSHEFVSSLLLHSTLNYEKLEIENVMMERGELCARRMRRRRPDPRGTRFSAYAYTPITQLIYETEMPTPSHIKRPRRYVAVYEIDKTDAGYFPRRSEMAWQGPMPQDRGQEPLPGRLQLSRDPWLTSDVLSLDVTGSFVKPIICTVDAAPNSSLGSSSDSSQGSSRGSPRDSSQGSPQGSPQAASQDSPPGARKSCGILQLFGCVEPSQGASRWFCLRGCPEDAAEP